MPAGRSVSTSPDPEDDKKSAAESEDENEEEYEIEEILDAKRGHFANGRIGYFVKWKGYGSDENSWVDENDAGNAQALIDAYWNKNQHKKRFPETKSAKKGRQSTASASAARGSASAARSSASAAGKKRGRPSAAAKDDSDAESEDESMSVDHPREDSPPTAKRARKGATSASKVATKSSKAAARSAVSDSASPGPSAKPKEVGRIDKSYLQHASWEKLVKHIDTVEMENDTLMVYFTLANGERAGEPSKVCNQRFPQKMLKFYESNLQWRANDDLAPNGDAAESE